MREVGECDDSAFLLVIRVSRSLSNWLGGTFLNFLSKSDTVASLAYPFHECIFPRSECSNFDY